MKVTLTEPDLLKESISIVSELVSEVRFKVNATAMEMIAMDAANVAMIIFKMFSSAFAEYKVDGETELGLNLLNLKQILKRAKKSDILTLELSEDKRLKIQLKSKISRTFYVPLIDIHEGEQQIPQLEFKGKVKTKSEIISDAIEDADVIADSVGFMIEDNKFVIEAKGDSSKLRVEVPNDEETSITASENIKAKYSIEYLKKMLKASKLSEDVELQFSTDYPLRLDFVSQDKLQLVFILAPRVEND
ncbi:MAG: proliferating cell nuclear antigen [Candidatus Woesearchaeota archaeon]|nr:proliferating cell nuclear antigen [Candidatus Woesearchaeota archaeon]MDN5327739.1 proliferating cell nuclear antigen [Candidatus Woesearchaeota archaeon]